MRTLSLKDIPKIASSLLLIIFSLAPMSPARASLSKADEVKLGKEVMSEVRALGLTEDPSLVAIGKRLEKVVQRNDLPWRFWVVEKLKGYNAFAAPGGFVFITRSYYEKLNDDEAAFVIGHEMAHVELHHYEKQLKRYQGANLGSLVLRILTEGTGMWGTAVDLGATAYVTHYSRVLEREADFSGYKLAEKAGFDARAAVTALSKLGKQPELHPWFVNIYATHPVLSSREDRLAALGGEEPDQVKSPPPSPSHKQDLTQGLQPLDPPASIAIRMLGPDGKSRWENGWRKDFTRLLHQRLIPLGFKIAGDDIMYKPEIGDPIEAARSRGAQFLLLVTVHHMESTTTSAESIAGTPVQVRNDMTARLVSIENSSQLWEKQLTETKQGVDILPADTAILYPDTAIGQVAERIASETALGCAKAAGAKAAAPIKTAS